MYLINHFQHASNTKPPKFNPKPKLPLHRQDNWKMAHEYMKMLGINIRGIEPAGTTILYLCTLIINLCCYDHALPLNLDLAKVLPAAIHNMFNQVIKWHDSSR